jgi:hypothetical protein
VLSARTCASTVELPASTNAIVEIAIAIFRTFEVSFCTALLRFSIMAWWRPFVAARKKQATTRRIASARRFRSMKVTHESNEMTSAERDTENRNCATENFGTWKAGL